MGTDRNKRGVELALPNCLAQIGNGMFQHEFDADILDAFDLVIQHVSWQPVCGNSEVHHAAGKRPCLADLDIMSKSAQVIRSRKTARSAADDQHSLSGIVFRCREFPALLYGEVPDVSLNCVDADALVDMLPVALVFAGVIANPAVNGGQRIVRNQDAPGLLVIARLRLIEPGLNVLASGAGVIAWRLEIDINRAMAPQRSGQGVVFQIGCGSEIALSGAHPGSPCVAGFVVRRR